MYEEDPTNLVVYIGRGENTNFHVVDDELKEVLLLVNVRAEIYKRFGSCYFYNQRCQIKPGEHVLLKSGNMGKLTELIFVKEGDRVYRFFRMECFEKIDVMLKDFQVFEIKNSIIIAHVDTIARKVIAYPYNENAVMCIDYDRPNFDFNFPVPP